MKVLSLVTATIDPDNNWGSLASLGHETVVQRYDDRPHARHRELIDFARHVAPDLIVYAGAPQPYYPAPVPTPDVLHDLNKVAPMVHLCGDASDHPWWPILEEYDREKCFTVQVAFDGGPSPIQTFHNGLTLLTPRDPRVFVPEPWQQRAGDMVMVGGHGHGDRGAAISALMQRGVLTHYPHGRPYEQLAQIYCHHKVVFNHPMTGSGQRKHVKGRVIEAGCAGCVLLDHKDSPTRLWFVPGLDYLAYETPEHAADLIERADDSALQAIASRFHSRVVQEHSPAMFWGKIIGKIKDLQQ